METAPLLPSYLNDPNIDTEVDTDWIEPTPLARKAKESLASARRQPSSTHGAVTPDAKPRHDGGDMPDVERFLLRIRNAQTAPAIEAPVYAARASTPPAEAAPSGVALKLPGTSLPDQVSTGERIPGSRILSAQGPTLSPSETPGSLMMPFLVGFIVVASIVLALELAGLWP